MSSSATQPSASEPTEKVRTVVLESSPSASASVSSNWLTVPAIVIEMP